ncbi:hypothetical protein [Actinoallomurus soli]|uniref:hypothetical protein n=1 Tax=Actinoallomurus soli TaxID=2952535 RepID=UPI002093D4C2|nr:hypothetical protein [Actinoallomurus soli]MCO5971617.1 hypothetical protein [Actinoallomurus soli]
MGVAGLWLAGVGIAILTNFRELATWWARQYEIWRPSPRHDAPITPQQWIRTRVVGLVFLTGGLLAVVTALVVVTDWIIATLG